MNKQELLSDFVKAVSQLEVALAIPPENNVIKAGCIQYFEFGFELAWKTIKQFADDEGLAECNSPKSALKTAFSQQWIDDEAVWLEMLAARNKMSHTYSASSALAIFDRLRDFHVALQKLSQKLSN